MRTNPDPDTAFALKIKFYISSLISKISILAFLHKTRIYCKVGCLNVGSVELSRNKNFQKWGSQSMYNSYISVNSSTTTPDPEEANHADSDPGAPTQNARNSNPKH